MNLIVTSGSINTRSPYSFIGKEKNLWMFIILFLVAFKGASRDTSIEDSINTFNTKIPPEQVIKMTNLSQIHFIKDADKHINFGIVGNEYNYIILKLNSSKTYAGQYLSIDNTSLDFISIYRIYSDGKNQQLYQGGELVPFNKNRKYVWHTVQVEISNTPSYYLIALKAAQENINVKYELLDRDDLQQKYQAYDRIVFFYIGFVCLTIAIIILAFLLFKEIVFAAYLGYILFASIWIVSHYGYVFPYVYPHFPMINEIIKPISSLGACFFLLLVLRIVFNQNLQSKKWLDKLIRWILSILPGLIILMFLLLIHNLPSEAKAILIVFWHIGLIFSIFITVFTPLYCINTGATAKIFSLAMFVICIMSLIQLLANVGFINIFFINEHGMTMGSMLENSIMAFGLFYNLLQERKQREIQVLSLKQEQAETLKKMINLQDNERKRIAGDLHDNIGPLLAALKINFRRIIHTKEEYLQDGLIDKTESIIDDSIAEIRNVAHDLMPKSLSSKGLINTLNDYFESLQPLYNKTIDFHHQIESILNPDLQINIYRIICELALNAAEHSNASLITITIMTHENLVSVKIQDNGQGFDPKAVEQDKSLGLQSSESRVQYLRGKFSLMNEPGKGTHINIEIPL